MFSKKFLGLCLMLVLGCMFMVAACDSSNDPVDKFIADYEKIVVKIEQGSAKSGGLTEDERMALVNELMELMSNSKDVINDPSKLSAKQTAALEKLSQRLEATSKANE